MHILYFISFAVHDPKYAVLENILAVFTLTSSCLRVTDISNLQSHNKNLPKHFDFSQCIGRFLFHAY
jgi:hypothetical protein